MKGSELLRLVDQMQREKNIPKEVIFEGIEQALKLAAERHLGILDPESSAVTVSIDRFTGDIKAMNGEVAIAAEELGRIAAQSAKQVMIQKIREAECNTVYQKFDMQRGELVRGIVQRVDAGTSIVSMDKHEAILPRSESIPGETHHAGETVKAVVLEVRKNGSRVKIVLSRNHPDFVRCLFEGEIPEVSDHTIEIKAIAREAGYRSKIAVSSVDMKVDCVGACVGVRGSRIKNIIDELGGERIDIVRWNDSLQVMIPNALQPAHIEEVFIYPRLGRAIVLVLEDQLSLAIGRRGQNVRLASKLVGWDIEIMTHDELNEGITRAEQWFMQLPGATPEGTERLIEEGFLSYTDLTFVEPSDIAELTSLDEDAAEEMIACAEEWAEEAEQQAKELDAQQAKERDEAKRQAALHPLVDPNATPTVAQLFGDDAVDAAPAPKVEVAAPAPTIAELFGDDASAEPEPAKPVEPLTAAKVFGDAPVAE